MAQPDMIGNVALKDKVFPIIDDEWRPEQVNKNHHHSKKILSGEEETNTTYKSNYFSKDRHEAIFLKLSKGRKTVKYMDLLPYLMIFYEFYLLQALNVRRKSYKELIDDNLIRIFKEVGLTELNKKQITYKMVEQTLLTLRSNYPKNLKFEGIQNILNLCKLKMEVDHISCREKKKMSFYTEHPPKYNRNTDFEFQNAFKRRFGRLHLNQLLIKN